MINKRVMSETRVSKDSNFDFYCLTHKTSFYFPLLLDLDWSLRHSRKDFVGVLS